MVRTSYQNEFSRDAAISEHSNGSYQRREVMESGNCEWIFHSSRLWLALLTNPQMSVLIRDNSLPGRCTSKR